MANVGDFGGRDPANAYCVHCSDTEGNLVMTFEQVVAFYSKDFVRRRRLDPVVATRIATAMVAELPVWKTERENQ